MEDEAWWVWEAENPRLLGAPSVMEKGLVSTSHWTPRLLFVCVCVGAGVQLQEGSSGSHALYIVGQAGLGLRPFDDRTWNEGVPWAGARGGLGVFRPSAGKLVVTKAGE